MAGPPCLLIWPRPPTGTMGRNAGGWHGGRASGRVGLGAGWNLGNSVQSNCRTSENRPGENEMDGNLLGTRLQASGWSCFGSWTLKASSPFPGSSRRLWASKPHCLGQESCWGQGLTYEGALASTSRQTPPAPPAPSPHHASPLRRPSHSTAGSCAWHQRPPVGGGRSGLCRPWCWSLCLGCCFPFFTWKTTSLPGPNASPPELKPLDPRHRENAEQPLVSHVPSSPVVAQGPFAHAAFSPDCKRSGGSARSEVNRASGAAPRSPASVSVCEMLEGMNK